MSDNTNRQGEPAGNQPRADPTTDSKATKTTPKSSYSPSRRRVLKAAGAAGVAGGLGVSGFTRTAAADHGNSGRNFCKISGYSVNADSKSDSFNTIQVPDVSGGAGSAIKVWGPPTYDGGQPGHWRMLDYTNGEVGVRFEEWEYIDNRHHVPEVFSLFAVPEGTTKAGSIKMHGGDITVSGNENWEWYWPYSFDYKPVVLHNPVTYNGSHAIVSRLDDVTNESLYVALQEQESKIEEGEGHKEEEVHIVALQAGVADRVNSHRIETGIVTDVDHTWTKIFFDQTYLDPTFVASIQTFHGNDPCSLRRRNLTRNSVEIKIEEEQSYDDEPDHVYAEEVGYVVVDDKEMKIEGTDGDTPTLAQHVSQAAYNSSDSYYSNYWDNTFYADHNWSVSLVSYDPVDKWYQFAVQQVHHTYFYNHSVTSDWNPWKGIKKLRTHAELCPGYDDCVVYTSEIENDTNKFVKTVAPNDTEWVEWVDNHKGEKPYFRDAMNRLEEKGYNDDGIPAWLTNSAFLAGSGATALAISSVSAPLLMPALSLGSTPVGAVTFVDWLEDWGASPGEKKTKDHGQLWQKDWHFDGAKPLSVTNCVIDVRVSDAQKAPIALHVAQIMDGHNDDYDNLVEDGHLNVNQGQRHTIMLPSDGGNPWVKKAWQFQYTDTFNAGAEPCYLCVDDGTISCCDTDRSSSSNCNEC